MLTSNPIKELIDKGRRQQAIALEEGFPPDREQGSDLSGGGSGNTSLLQGIVVAHGDPDPVDDRIYTHKVRPLIYVDHKTPPVYDGRDPEAEPPPDPPVVEFEVSPFEPGGWFHVGQVIEFQEIVAGIFKAHCHWFMGIITKVRYVDGVDPVLDPLDTVEVTPFDGDWSQGNPSALTLYDGTDPPSGIGDGRIPQALMYPGAALARNNIVTCKYTGLTVRSWLVDAMHDITGHPDDPDYAFSEPLGQGNVCIVADPELPVQPPTSDDLDDALPDIQEQ